jgi:three-Cys-motif partner protein
MPRSDLDQHFRDERPEWTERKHRLLERIVIPAAEKMKRITGCLALVDGYAGPNTYGRTVQGSTTILAAAARRLADRDFPVKVFACEPIRERFDQLVQNLAPQVESGLLTAYNHSHAEALPAILQEIETWPAIVFLDPHGPKDLQLEADLLPWLRRPKTDVLGVFMGNAAARACAEAAGRTGSAASRKTAEAILGPHWREATTEAEAYRVLLNEISGRKRFVGLYPLRKKETLHRAYAVFGASDSEHGFHLLSDAVARDWGALADFDFSRKEPTLFSDIDKEDEQQADFDRLVELVQPVLQREPTLTGQKLALALYRHLPRLDAVFGRYKESDYTKAAQACRRSTRDG